jgi:ATP-dependent Clp protease ATP-binding subunit ClpC
MEFLANKGFDPEFGARPLRRTIQRLVENELSRMLLDGTLNEGDSVTVKLEGGKLQFDVSRGASGDGEGNQKVESKSGAGGR